MKHNQNPSNNESYEQRLQEITQRAHSAYGEQSTVSVVHGYYVIKTNIPVPEYNWEENKNSYAHIAYNTPEEEWDNDYYQWANEFDRWEEYSDHELVPRYEKQMEEAVNYMRIAYHIKLQNNPRGKIAKEYHRAYPNDELNVTGEQFIPDSQVELTREQRVIRYDLLKC